MQSDKAAKQKTVPGRLSVAVLYVTVNRLLIPVLPGQTAQETPAGMSDSRKVSAVFVGKWDVERNGDLCSVAFKVSGLLSYINAFLVAF